MFSFGKPHRVKKAVVLTLMAAGLALAGAASAQTWPCVVLRRMAACKPSKEKWTKYLLKKPFDLAML